MRNIISTKETSKKTIQQFILLVVLIAFAIGCKKENLTTLIQPNSAELKTVDVSNYNKLLGAVYKRAEFESYCGTDYLYTDSIYVNGVVWEYSSAGYEYLMYKGLTHFKDANNNYFFAGLVWPTDGYEYGIGFGNKIGGPGYFPFTANVTVSIPEKNFTLVYNNAACFAIGDENLSHVDSVRIVLRKKQTQDFAVVADSILSFAQLKNKLGLGLIHPDSVSLYSSIGKVASFDAARVYNWIYYSSNTSDIYGLENASLYSNNLNFGDGLNEQCSGGIDIYLHKDGTIYGCKTSYSIFYMNYLGSRKQLHIYE